MADTFRSAAALLSCRDIRDPIFLIRPHLVASRARAVVDAFPGDVLYAVKCNDTPLMLEALWTGGVREFDTASIGEIRAVRECLPAARCHFMHPVKNEQAIAEAYFEHEVRRFVFDHEDELDKILDATGHARDLELFLRIVVPNEGAMLTLTGKFGASADEATDLLAAARRYASQVGLTFHVGSQCLLPAAFARAVRMAAGIAVDAGGIDHLDIGGGFPAQYRGDEPSFETFVRAALQALDETGLECGLQCEPGRLLVADGASVLTRVELRRRDALYLNDGVYGNLAELRWLGPQFPIAAVRDGGAVGGPLKSFDLYGPTCDSIDSMPGPHWMPAAVREGDWLEVGMMGAYSNALNTGFNGFDSQSMAILLDTPDHRLHRETEAPALRVA